MPNNGIIFETEAYEFKVEASASTSFSGDGTPHHGYGAEGSTSFCEFTTHVMSGIALSVESGPGMWAVGFSYGFLNYSNSGTEFVSSLSITARLTNLKLYGKITGSLHRLVCDSIEIYEGDTLVDTLAGLDVTSSGCGPQYVPVIGLPFTVTGSATASADGITGEEEWEFDARTELSVGGGWRFKDADSEWTALPVTPYSGSMPTGDGPYGLPTPSSPAEFTFGSLLNLLDARSESATETIPSSYLVDITTEVKTGVIVLQPDIEKAIDRSMGNDYRQLWYRATFPETKASLRRAWAYPDEAGDSVENQPVVHPETDVLLSTVGNTAHAIEDVMGYTSYAPVQLGHSKNNSIRPTIGLLGGFDPVEDATAESVSVEFPLSVADWDSYLGHDDQIVRYVASWCHPQWSYFYWRDNWEVDGGAVDWDIYWGQIREQHIQNDDLNPKENRLTRNSNILTLLWNEQGNEPFLTALASGLFWIGSSRWKVDSASVDSEITLSETRPGEWSVVDDEADLAFGSGGITVSGFDGSSADIDLEFGSFTEDPYMLLYLAKKVQLSWEFTDGPGAVEVQLVGIDDAVTVLDDLVEGVMFTLPKGEQTDFAGSWAIDNGNGAVTDTGSDVAPTGLSSATMSDSERVMAFQLGNGRTWKALRFHVTGADSETELVIEWPEFELWDDHPTAIWESGKTAAWLWPNGPGIRWGQWTWYLEGIGFQDPPVVSGLGTANTIIDWLAWRFRVLQGAGTSDLAGEITTLLGTLYDSYEGQSIAVVDKFSMAVPLPKGSDDVHRGALINSFAEVPPLSMFPYRKRSTADWSASGDYAQVVYDWAFEKRPIVSTSGALVYLVDDSGTIVGETGTAPTGWQVWRFAPQLDGTEDEWKVRTSTREYGEVRPWHGWFCLLKEAAGTSNHVTAIQLPWGAGVVAWSDGTGIWVARSNYPVPFSYDMVAKLRDDADDVQPRLRVEFGLSRLWMVWRRSVEMWEAYSDDDGKTWSEPALVASDVGWVDGWSDRRGFGGKAYFEYDSGTSGPGKIKLRVRGPGDTSFGSWITVEVGGTPVSFADGSYKFWAPEDQQSTWMLSATKEGDSAPTNFCSYDEGTTWAEI